MPRTLLKLLKFLGFALIGGLTAAIVIGGVLISRLPDMEPWHQVYFDEEFTAHSGVTTLEGYLELEHRLFEELKTELLDELDFGATDDINRFQTGSVSNPDTWPFNWNRTYYWQHSAPKASVLLLHGMSDGPYSLRTVGEHLHAAGATVLGLRLPGHGTAPSGLLDISAEDMIAATELAVRHLRSSAPDRPVHVVGYSNGAALAVVHALRQLEDPELARIDKIAIVSPAIGVTPAAAYAPLAIKLGHILGAQRLAWSSVGPEYDPFKYTSFALNAGYVTHELTVEIRERMNQQAKAQYISDFPTILGFSSVVDATVIVQDMISNLYAKLPENGSELFLFDTNHRLTRLPLLADDAAQFIDPIIRSPDRAYRVSLITNITPGSQEVELRDYAPGSEDAVHTPISRTWPDGTFSLSHIALPFEEIDPLYGSIPDPEVSQLQLGALALRGERGISKITPSDMLRMRWNPFHDLMLSELQRFLDLPPPQ